MRDELLKYHTSELERVREGLRGWETSEAPCGDEKCKQEHVETFKALVDFHERAVKWLRET